MISPTTTCPLTALSCDKELDCSNCEVFRLKGPKKVEWVCAFCAVGWHRAWLGASYDVVVGGLYKAGRCSRCDHDRICLMPIVGQKVKQPP